MHKLSIRALADGLRAKKFSSRELTQHFLKRMESHDKALNSFVTVTADQALKAAEAKNVEALFNAGGEIYKVCAACHQRYAPQLQGPPDQAGK